MIVDLNDWANDTFGNCELGDKRRTARVVKTAQNLASNVGSSIASASPDVSHLEGSYRLIRNKNVSADAIAESGFKATARAASEYDELLALEDTTSLNYQHSVVEDLGHVGNSSCKKIKGMLAHSVLLYVPEQEQVVGLIEQRRWIRENITVADPSSHQRKSYETKESYKWELASEAVASRLKQHMSKCIAVCDREADIIEYLSYKHTHQQRFIVRAHYNRPLEQGNRLYDYASDIQSAGQYTVNVPQRGGRNARQATLNIRYAPVNVLAPERKQATFAPINAYVVYCDEMDSSNVKQALKWCLLTSEPITTKDQALKIVKYYELRWKVELFHKVWKSEGTNVQGLRMQERDNLERMAVIQAFIATRLMQLKEMGDSEKAHKLPCTQCLSATQWKILFKALNKKKKLPKKVPDMKWAYQSMGKLGGWKDTKRTGRVSWKTLWTGWDKLEILIEGYELMMAEM